MIKCYRCSLPLPFEPGNVGRRDTCPKCGFDVRVCKNCKNYDPAVYNECRETQADRVVDKEKANFCDYFSLGGRESRAGESKDDVLKRLDDLFKK